MDIVQDVYNSLEASTKEVQKIVAEQNDLEEKVKNAGVIAQKPCRMKSSRALTI